MPHSPIGQFLLEFIACIFDSLTGCLDIIYRDTGMAEALMWLCISIIDLVVGVILGAVAEMRRLVQQKALEIPECFSSMVS